MNRIYSLCWFRVSLSVSLFLSACHGPETLSFSVPGVRVVPGQHLQLELTGANAGTGSRVIWASADSEIAVISADGVVEGIAPGRTSVSATLDGQSVALVCAVIDGAMLGAAGGQVWARDGGVSLTVPPGALAVPTPVGLDTARVFGPLDPRVVQGGEVELVTPSSFSSPMKLELHYDVAAGPFGGSAGRFALAQLDGEAWTELVDSHDDPAAAQVSANITEPGVFGARYANAKSPCLDAQSRQFDFWLGSWAVTFDNQPSGRSAITRDDAGCLIDERYSSGPYRGASVSFYEATTAKWYQTYIDSSGVRLLLSGRFSGGKMVLSSPGPNVTRITWAPSPSQVTQSSQTSRSGGPFASDFEAAYVARQTP